MSSSSYKKDFADIRGYFTLTEWTRLAEAEKERYSRIKENHLFMKSIGLKSNAPAFMDKKSHGLMLPVPESSDEEEEEEWSPHPERQHGPTAVRAPVKRSAREDSAPHSATQQRAGPSKAIISGPPQREEKVYTRGGNLRNLTKVNYEEPKVPEDDHYFFCDVCKEFFLEECWLHGPPVFIPDVEVAQGERDRAKKTLPVDFQLKKSGIPKAGLGVYCGKTGVPVGTHFGPYEGDKADEEEAVKSGYSWMIYKDKRSDDYIDAKRETHSNWMRYVNCARNEAEQNLIAFQHLGTILYRCCRRAAPGEELLVWYGDEYGAHLGIIFDQLWDQKSSTKGVKTQSLMFTCTGCQYRFTSETFLHKHMKRVHAEMYLQLVGSGHIRPERLLPSTASQPTTSCGSLSAPPPCKPPSERQTVTGKPRPHRCDQCGQGFTSPSELKRHQLIHTGEKPYRCDQCDRAFTLSHHLKDHRRIHTGEKPYHCDQCDRAFTLSAHLKRHQLIHSGEKPYHCDQCDRAFTQSGDLKIHQRSHTGEKPYHCDQCGRAFSTSGNLKIHQLTHTGEKPYHCDQCGKDFSRLGNLKQHKSTHSDGAEV